MRRVIGQCTQVDFASIEHLALITEDPEKLDTSTLKKTEEELIAHYRQSDFDCLVLWEYEVWDGVEVSNRIRDYFSRGEK